MNATKVMKIAAMAAVTTLSVAARVRPGDLEVLVGRIGPVKVMVGISAGVGLGGTGAAEMRLEGMRVSRADGMGRVTP